MSSTKLKGLLFLISSTLLAACCFMPIARITVHMSNGSVEESLVKIMPSLQGFIVLILAVLCIGIPLMGIKSKAAMAATIAALSAGGIVAYASYNASRQDYTSQAINTIMQGVFGTSANTVTDWKCTNEYGLYLFVVAIFLVLITGFVYTLAEDDY